MEPTAMPSPRLSSRLPALPAFALCVAVWTAALAVPAQAQTAAPAAARADAKAGPRADAKSDPRAAPQADPKADPLDRLRERLSRQLGAAEAAKGGSNAPTVMRVENPAPGELRLQATPGAPRSPGTARPPAGTGGSQAGAAGGSRAAATREAPHVPWSYLGADGPHTWGALAPAYALCGRGQRQSPIDVVDGLPVDLEAPQFQYKPGFFGVVDNGHTVQVAVARGSAFELGGRRYVLDGFHFHLPGEERIDGKGYEMSIHLTHRDAQGRIAVVALLVQEGEENPAVQTVWNHLPLERGEVVQSTIDFDPTTLLPAGRRYYTYMGSLTTPPCTEGVLWIVMQQPVTVSPAQRRVFARLHPMNARPIQPLGGRLIKQSR
jgi:carbonic anhydrase